ncbi:MAG: sulfurtransferase complex subunit TusB [Halioglobus sp.]
MILHTLNTGPNTAAFTECLQVAASGDALLLTGDGVYCSISDTDACNLILDSGAELYVLETDACAAGIQDKVCNHATLTDYDGFVGLSERFTRQLAWY